MSVAVEALFTSALGLQLPWVVEDVKLDTAKRRIDFEIGCHRQLLACPACGAATQPVHDRLRRSWRHLDFFQFEAWLHCDVPRVACGLRQDHAGGRALGAPGLGLHRGVRGAGAGAVPELPVRQAASCCAARTSGCGGASSSTSRRRVRWRLRRRAHSWASTRPACARARTTSPSCTTWIQAAAVRHRGARPPDGGGVRRGPQGPWRRSRPGAARVHGHERGLRQGRGAGAARGADQLRPLSRRGDGQRGDGPGAPRGDGDRRPGGALGAGRWRPQDAQATAVGHAAQPQGWSGRQLDAMHWLQRSTLKSARAWRLKMALREVYARATAHNSIDRPHPTSGPG
jgi:transposase